MSTAMHDPLHPFTPARVVKAVAPTLVTGVICLLVLLSVVWLGPMLDAEPDRRSEFAAADEDLRTSGELARFEAEARARCARIHGDNGGVIHVDGGLIICTDKHGRDRHTLRAELRSNAR